MAGEINIAYQKQFYADGRAHDIVKSYCETLRHD